jgi:cystathionine beta-lyase/cystathionine gamma-synthase
MKRNAGLSTRLVHAGEASPRIGGALSAPIFQTSTYETGDEARYEDVRYHRLNNSPNHRILAAKLASAEGADEAVVTGSGMAAISTALLSCLEAGDHLLVQRGLYGGTFSLVTGELAAFGISHTFVDGADPDSWAAALRPETRALYVEAITNPLLEVGELAAAAAFARERGLTSLIDATFATPVNLRPLELGFDLVLHSASKYLNGHSDLVAGVIAGRAAPMARALHRLNHLGGCLSPHGCFLLYRGLKTLALRVRAQNEGAAALAAALAAHPAVVRVRYPGLPEDPSHQRASRWFSGFGGMLSFDLAGGAAAADALIARLTWAVYAPSLGGPETLITLPSRTTHLSVPRAERLQQGITDGLVRVSVGIEDPEDLTADFLRALDAIP